MHRKTLMQDLETKNNRFNIFEGIGWLLSLLIPIVLYFGLTFTDVTSEIVLFLSILSSAIVMWIFKLFPEYLPGIFVIIICAALGFVPTSVILSGFSSETFIMIFSVLCITILIARSGLISRLLLLLIKVMPQKERYFNLAFFLGFIILTPLIPSIVSRTQLAAHSISNFINMLKLDIKNESITKLTASAFFGASLLSSVFLSASLMNFIILALIPLQEQQSFQLAGWFQASFIAGVVILLTYFAMFSVFFRGKETLKLNKQFVTDQLKFLGSPSKDEKIALFTICLFFIGMITYPYHRISPSWIGFSLVYILMTFSILDRNEKIDWPFLLFMASVVGISSIINYLNISVILAPKLQLLMKILGTSQEALFSFLVISTILVRLVLPIGATIAILVPVFLPLAGLYGISYWAVCFVILVVVDIWFFPYQCIFYTLMCDSFTEGKIPFEEKKFLQFNAIVNIARILAIFASLYYWQWLGLI